MSNSDYKHRKHYLADKMMREEISSSFLAKRAGKCSTCGKHFSKGTLVYYPVPGKKLISHYDVNSCV